MAELLITPSQTIGPFFKDGMELSGGGTLFPDSVPGRRIRVAGVVTDGQGKSVSDALLEFWQPDAAGRFGGPRQGTSSGFGRVLTGKDGRYSIDTILPGAVPAADGKPQAPHILVVIFARGLLRQLVTRIYFDGQASNAADPALARCGARAATLVAKRDGADVYAWNISLQGTNETVFFEA